MNIVEAAIDEYGHLSHAKYEISTGQLTLIYGLNEAGKSTLFHFIETMLFGFSKRKHELEHFMPDQATQYGGYCIVQLDSSSYIKVTRYLKRHKGAPVVTKLERHHDDFQVVEEQLLHQDEFEKLYMSGLTRDMFRDLCALTLDELQATSMKDDEQLNQHLYHATWESSKMIAKLEEESSKVVEKLYRPRGTKQEINQLLSQYKEVKSALHAMENELDAYASIQQQLVVLQENEHQLKMELTQKSEALALLQKVEQDFPLYEQYEAIKYEQSKLNPQRQSDSALLNDLQQYFKIKLEKHTLIEELEMSKQQLQQELAKFSVDEPLLKQQQQVVDQYSVMEALLEDIETRREEEKKLAQYIKQKSYIAHTYIPESVIQEQLWTNEKIEQLSHHDMQEKQANQSLVLLHSQKEQLEQKRAAARNQINWVDGKLTELELEKNNLSYTFVPQQLDELIKAEASYEEGFKRINLSHTLSQPPVPAKRTRLQQNDKRGRLSPSLLVISGIAIFISTLLLVTQFTVTNLLIVLLIVCGVSFFIYQQLKVNRNSSNLHNISDEGRDKQDFYNALYKLIVLPTTQHSEWTTEQDYDLRKMLQKYKSILKSCEQLYATKASEEKQLFELDFQIKQLEQQLNSLEQQEQQRKRDWEQFILQAQLPEHASIQSIKAFVSQLDELTDNLASYKQMQNRRTQDEQRINHYMKNVNSLIKNGGEQDERLEYVYMQLKHQYDEHVQAYKQVQQLQQQYQQVIAQLDMLQAPLVQKINEIKALYHLDADEEDIWKLWVDVEAEWEQYNLELFKIEQQRRQLVSPEQMTRLNEQYWSNAYTSLIEQASLLYSEVEQLHKQVTLTLEERGQLQERLNNLCSNYERQQLQMQHDSLEERIKQGLKHYAKYALVDYVVKKTRTQFEAEHQPALMMKASHYINQLTEGKYIKLVLNPDTKSFQLATKAMRLLPIERLSRGTAELVYFSLRIALLTTHKALNNAPLIVDDPFVNFDKLRQRQMLTFIHELAEHRQVILLTCHDHIVELSEQVGQAQFVRL